ncbi:AfsR/SARP family transcriptional regulator [Micromonospora sp. WMMD1102]|uniref:AfsR/SARP family transcriptional regulator n=1 Tax=Micromonospora sp. WMMD1102 TaxID=3016105 RepID=UPI002414DD26|nr:AfsR/SARP family transcriptional regulator [Micromonospora sp. WMMD1102]MDG4786095.1 AfsR/SARP family transcriptional regulator [Micromonospora sp. WMMD1102]
MVNGVLEIGLLGPVRVLVDGRPVSVAAPRRQVTLGALALTPGRSVSISVLARYLWGEDVPELARRALSTIVTRLRHDLGTDVIASGTGGYTLDLPRDTVDVYRFRALAGAARSARPADELRLLDAALACWRGMPLQDVASEWLVAEHAPGLTEEWYGVTERRIDLLLAAGGHGDLLPQLRDLTAREPLRESMWGRLMVALYRAGRQAEALETYQSVREVLVDQLGVGPSEELRSLHRAVLTNDPAIAAPVTVTRPLRPIRRVRDRARLRPRR